MRIIDTQAEDDSEGKMWGLKCIQRGSAELITLVILILLEGVTRYCWIFPNQLLIVACLIGWGLAPIGALVVHLIKASEETPVLTALRGLLLMVILIAAAIKFGHLLLLSTRVL